MTPHFLFLEYFATGEGMTMACRFSVGDLDMGIETMLKDIYGEEVARGTSSYNYFAPAVTAIPITDIDQLVPALESCGFGRPMIDHLIKQAQDGALMNFRFQHYFNYS